MNDIYYIIGTAYAGKSTMVKLLAEKYDGIACEENYHDQLVDDKLDKNEFPCLCYTRDLQDWREFIRRTPEEYAAWVSGVAQECEVLELRILEDLKKQGRKIFVDTNISIETLKRISDEDHVLVMLSDQMVSVKRFFERPDREKQFLYQLLMQEPDPEAAMANFREMLMRVNSQEAYDTFLYSGFRVLLRDDNRTVEETLRIVEEMLRLTDIELVPVGKEDIEEIWKMQVEAFQELLDRYQDYDTNPAAEGVDRIRERYDQPGSVYYFIVDGQEKVGVIRVIDKKDGSRKRISPIWIMPAYRGRGYAQYAIRKAEELYGPNNWCLDTILQEKGNLYLYEKMGYHQTGRVEKINDRMDIVFYEKD